MEGVWKSPLHTHKGKAELTKKSTILLAPKKGRHRQMLPQGWRDRQTQEAAASRSRSQHQGRRPEGQVMSHGRPAGTALRARNPGGPGRGGPTVL